MAWLGITNENEFFSYHYLSEIFSGDIQDRLSAWREQEEQSKQASADNPWLAPFTRLNRFAREAQQTFTSEAREKSAEKRLQLQREWLGQLLPVFGFEMRPRRVPIATSAGDDLEIPLLADVRDRHGQPLLWILEALAVAEADADPLTLPTHEQQLLSLSPTPIPAGQQKALKDRDWQDLLTTAVYTEDHPPRWVLLVTDRQWLLLDRPKFAQGRLLRFDWLELFARREADTLKAVSVLLHRESILSDQSQGAGQSLLDTLNENAHKHAYGVSEDLKYALREAIELLGNEATRQLVERAREQQKGIFTGKRQLDAAQLTLESLRFMYRLLFLFYIEARPELGYAPIRNEVYLRGYSLESLRELELIPLTTEREQNGRYIDDTLRTLFRLIDQGHQPGPHEDMHATRRDGFELRPLQCHLFDPARTPLLNKVVFPNRVLQRVIQLMSLTRPGPSGARRRKRRGRISYAQLGINQLGAVYEALLSYRGFFAREDLYEVKRAGQNGNDLPDELDTGYFVNAAALADYTDDEKVYDRDELGHKKLRVYPQGAFIYRLAGRDREKSASYYTPEVLTRSLVKYALKEQLDPLPGDAARAERLLQSKICEPAMGSAAFLNEAINQLADKYLELAQSATGERIPQNRYLDEKQKVKMYLADNNCFGVDLNPVAVELAEVSIWLNALSSDRFIPWLGMQLNCGNSLIGARRQAWSRHQDHRGFKDIRLRRVPLFSPQRHKDHKEEETEKKNSSCPLCLCGESSLEGLRAGEIWHFLLPDHGMAKYDDKVVKARYPKQIKAIIAWRRGFTRLLDKDDLNRLEQLSAKIDALWQEHARQLDRLRRKTTDAYSIFGREANGAATSLAFKDQVLNGELRAKGLKNANAYQRLKLAMDYWCALWFWPIDKSHLLPDRDEYLFDLENLLLGDTLASGGIGEQRDLFAPTTGEAEGKAFVDKYGIVNLDLLFQHFPRLKVAQAIANKRKFFHWELEHADIFTGEEDSPQRHREHREGEERGGFDLVLGNPPWIKVEWQESGVLGDYRPLFVLRKFSATKLNRLRDETFDAVPELETAWREEFEESEGTQSFLNASVNYPLLKGVQTNLYKCFLPQAWMIGSRRGVSAFLHPEGIYDDPKGGEFRAAVYPRLRAHFQYVNELTLFGDVDHHAKFSTNIFGPKRADPAFTHIANLFVPHSINATFNHGGSGPVPGIKEESEDGGRVTWNTAGHRDRLIPIGEQELALFTRLYDSEGTPALQVRLPALHARPLLSVLNKFASQPRRLGDLTGQYLSLEMWHETNQQRDGTIRRETRFPRNAGEWVLSGPHFFVGTPFYKTPRRECTQNSHYDVLDLTTLPDDYLPRTNYVPACGPDEYRARTPRVPWVEEVHHRATESTETGVTEEQSIKRVTQCYRLYSRRQLSQSGESSDSKQRDRTHLYRTYPSRNIYYISIKRDACRLYGGYSLDRFRFLYQDHGKGRSIRISASPPTSSLCALCVLCGEFLASQSPRSQLPHDSLRRPLEILLERGLQGATLVHRPDRHKKSSVPSVSLW
jgi:hypothetical protein